MLKTPQLDPTELYDRRHSKDTARLKAYNKILEQIHIKIRVASKLPNSRCYILYTVPPFIFGLPKIDLEDCIVYLVHQLRQSKYEVKYTYPNLLFISWQHHEKSYIIEQSPIMLSMLESSERLQQELEQKEKNASRLLQPKKSQRKVRIEVPGSHSDHSIRTVLNSYPPPLPGSSQPARRAPLKAGEYVPNMSFLQGISNPPNNTPRPDSYM
jgi:hypothetical protein